MSQQQIHQTQPVLTAGARLEEAEAAVILLHGRGASAQSMLELAAHFPKEGIAYVIPQAANSTWYPNSGFSPFEVNEPYLSSAMATIHDLLAQIEAAGIPASKTILGGFSQGACLASEFVAQNATRYGGLLVFSGALMGPLDMPRAYQGSLSETPVFIGGVNQDSWVTETQLRHAAQTLEALGGQVTLQVLNGRDHTIRQSEVEQAATIIRQLTD